MNKKVYYRGNTKRGDEIIKALESLGGINKYKLTGKNDYYYYIGRDNEIYHAWSEGDIAWLLEQCYTEAFLTDGIVEFNGKKYRKSDLDEALSKLSTFD